MIGGKGKKQKGKVIEGLSVCSVNHWYINWAGQIAKSECKKTSVVTESSPFDLRFSNKFSFEDEDGNWTKSPNNPNQNDMMYYIKDEADKAKQTGEWPQTVPLTKKRTIRGDDLLNALTGNDKDALHEPLMYALKRGDNSTVEKIREELLARQKYAMAKPSMSDTPYVRKGPSLNANQAFLATAFPPQGNFANIYNQANAQDFIKKKKA
jgi:hypothetical protein